MVTLDAGEARLRALLRGQPDIRPEALVALSCEPATGALFRRGRGALRLEAREREDDNGGAGSSSRT